jgi:hypothetical protein
VGQTVTAVLQAGVGGINLEDAPPAGDGLFEVSIAAAP